MNAIDAQLKEIDNKLKELDNKLRNVTGVPLVFAHSKARLDLNDDLDVLRFKNRVESLEKRASQYNELSIDDIQPLLDNKIDRGGDDVSGVYGWGGEHTFRGGITAAASVAFTGIGSTNVFGCAGVHNQVQILVREYDQVLRLDTFGADNHVVLRPNNNGGIMWSSVNYSDISGTLSVDAVPNLDMSKITTGDLPWNRISGRPYIPPSGNIQEIFISGNKGWSSTMFGRYVRILGDATSNGWTRSARITVSSGIQAEHFDIRLVFNRSMRRIYGQISNISEINKFLFFGEIGNSFEIYFRYPISGEDINVRLDEVDGFNHFQNVMDGVDTAASLPSGFVSFVPEVIRLARVNELPVGSNISQAQLSQDWSPGLSSNFARADHLHPIPPYPTRGSLGLETINVPTFAGLNLGSGHISTVASIMGVDGNLRIGSSGTPGNTDGNLIVGGTINKTDSTGAVWQVVSNDASWRGRIGNHQSAPSAGLVYTDPSGNVSRLNASLSNDVSGTIPSIQVDRVNGTYENRSPLTPLGKNRFYMFADYVNGTAQYLECIDMCSYMGSDVGGRTRLCIDKRNNGDAYISRSGADQGFGTLYKLAIEDRVIMRAGGGTITGSLSVSSSLTVPRIFGTGGELKIGSDGIPGNVDGNLTFGGNLYTWDRVGETSARRLIVENDDCTWRGRIGNTFDAPSAGFVRTDGSGTIGRVNGDSGQFVRGDGSQHRLFRVVDWVVDLDSLHNEVGSGLFLLVNQSNNMRGTTSVWCWCLITVQTHNNTQQVMQELWKDDSASIRFTRIRGSGTWTTRRVTMGHTDHLTDGILTQARGGTGVSDARNTVQISPSSNLNGLNVRVRYNDFLRIATVYITGNTNAILTHGTLITTIPANIRPPVDIALSLCVNAVYANNSTIMLLNSDGGVYVRNSGQQLNTMWILITGTYFY